MKKSVLNPKVEIKMNGCDDTLHRLFDRLKHDSSSGVLLAINKVQ